MTSRAFSSGCLRLPLLVVSCAVVIAGCSGQTDGTGGAASDAVYFGADGWRFAVDVVEPSDAVADLTDGDDGAPGDGHVGDGANAGDVSVDAAAACPGGSGCPCNENTNCDNTLCIDTPTGKACAHSCIDTCPSGLTCAQVTGEGSDVLSICVPKNPRLCDPCAESKACVSLGAADGGCIDHGAAGRFCGVICSNDTGCPTGFGCTNVTTVEGATTKQCTPKTNDGSAGFGACSCSATAAAAKRSTTCWIPHIVPGSAVVAKCAGVATCTAEGPITCAAPEAETEVCDGKDNDCDAETDEATCDDKNPCTQDSCGGTSGCDHKALTDGLSCDADGSACTVGDACKSGLCAPGALKNCDDTNPCTKDACDLATGCTHTHDDGAPCSDDNPCTVGDICTAASCSAGVIKGCGSGKPCVVGACSLTTGACDYSDQPAGKVCDDGDACTAKDACTSGACVGAVVSCDDGDACSADTCDAAKGCGHQASSGPCNDGDACTTGDACVLGKCAGGSTKTCDDNDPCTKDTCSPQSGCASNAVADQTSCGAGQWCKAGACMPKDTVCAVTWNVGAKGSATVLSDGNKTMKSTASWNAARATLGRTSGKWYYEVVAKVDSNGFSFVGAGNATATLSGCCTGGTGSCTRQSCMARRSATRGGRPVLP